MIFEGFSNPSHSMILLLLAPVVHKGNFQLVQLVLVTAVSAPAELEGRRRESLYVFVVVRQEKHDFF